MDEEQAEERALPRGRDVHGPIAIDDLDWAQDPELHGARGLCAAVDPTWRATLIEVPLIPSSRARVDAECCERRSSNPIWWIARAVRPFPSLNESIAVTFTCGTADRIRGGVRSVRLSYTTELDDHSGKAPADGLALVETGDGED